MPNVRANLAVVKKRITAAAERVGQDPNQITLVAVTKDVEYLKLIEEAIAAGITDIGENRVQEAKPKIEALKSRYKNVKWHMIGHLQTNKVKTALELFDQIDSVDSLKLAEEIEKRSQKPAPVLIEVKTSEEATKFGVEPSELEALIGQISKLKNLKILGLMTLAPLTSDKEKARPYFRKLKDLSERVKSLNLPNVEMNYLSMGMTTDFEVAIEEGSNMVRLGRAIFGERGE